MKLASTTKFNGDYLLLRRMVLNGKINAKSAKGWVKVRGSKTAVKAEQEVDVLIKTHSLDNHTDKDKYYWKKEIINLLKDE